MSHELTKLKISPPRREKKNSAHRIVLVFLAFLPSPLIESFLTVTVNLAHTKKEQHKSKRSKENRLPYSHDFYITQLSKLNSKTFLSS